MNLFHTGEPAAAAAEFFCFEIFIFPPLRVATHAGHPGTARKYAALVKSMRGVMTIAHAEGFALASLVGNPERTNLGELVSYTDNSCRLFEEVLLRKRVTTFVVFYTALVCPLVSFSL